MLELQSVYELKDFISSRNTCAIFFYAEKHNESSALLQVYKKLAQSIRECDSWAMCLADSIAHSRVALSINEIPSVWFCNDHAIQRIVVLPYAQQYVQEARNVFVTRNVPLPIRSAKQTAELLESGCANAMSAARAWMADRPLLFLTTDTQSAICNKLPPEVIVVEDTSDVERYQGCLSALGLNDPQNALIINGEVHGQSLDTLTPELEKMIDEAVPAADAVLVRRCHDIVNRHPLMVVMKGTRDAPYCKFSKQLLAIFKEHEIEDWDFFNVFSDNAVRERLKTLFSWPTYPQIYVRGKLFGGLDAVKSLAEEGLGNKGQPSRLKQALFGGAL